MLNKMLNNNVNNQYNQQSKLITWTFFGIFAIVILIAGIFYYKSISEQFIQQVENELQATAELKVFDIVQWRKDMLKSAELLKNNKTAQTLVKEYFATPHNSVVEGNLQAFLTYIYQNANYESVFLLDTNFYKHLIVSNNSRDRDTSYVTKESVARLRQGKVAFQGLYKNSSNNHIYLKLLIPYYQDENDKQLIGVIAARIDPNEYLYPLFQKWPTNRQTAETILFTKTDTDSVLFLNDVRENSNSALNLIFSLNRKELPSVQVLTGKIGSITGRDYSGDEVYAFGEHIPYSPWYLLTKIDKSEVSQPLIEKAILLGLLILFLIGSLAALLGLVLRQQNLKFYRERLKDLQTIQKSEQNLYLTLNSIGDGVIATDEQGRITLINPVAEAMCGWTFTEANGQNLTDVFKIINAETREEVTNPVDIVLKKGKVVGLANHTVLISKEGKEYQIADSASPIINQEGKITGAILVFSDVTEKYKIQKQIKESEERYRYFFEHNDAIILMVDPDNGNITFANKTATNYYGYPKEQFIGMPISQINIMSPQEIKQKMQEARKKNQNYFNFKHRLANGEIRDVEVYQSTLYLQGKEIFSIIIHDITERKKAEEKLIESETTYRGIINSVTESILIFNADGYILDLNDATEYLYGYPKELLIGKTFDFFSAPNKNNVELIKQYIIDAYNGIPHQFDCFGLKKDGSIFPGSVSATSGKYFGEKVVIATIRDITERVKILDELVEAKQKAEESDLLKSAFLANMSHEIRTPMNGIIGFSQLVCEKDISDKEREEYSVILNQSCARLMNTVNDVLDLSKIDAGQMEVSYSSVNLPMFMSEIYNFHSYNFKIKNIELSYQIDNNFPNLYIKTDNQKMFQIFNNLLSNALKFTRKGKTEFGYKLKDQKVEFYVSDTGIGIASDAQEKIFRRFVQEDASLSRGHEGSGLGLSIAKGFLELLGGTIWVESEKDKGSTFYFSIPFIKSNKEEQAEIELELELELAPENDATEPTDLLKVLIAEDDDINFFFIDTFLKKNFHIQTYRATTGKEAVNLHNTLKDLHLILMDLKMPEMTGFEATKIIRKRNQTIPIIAITAYALEGDKEKALTAGCTDYIPKPIDINLLSTMISEYTKNRKK
jgi:PAS domain S-box-containing protein